MIHKSYKVSPDLQKEILASIIGGVYVMLSTKLDEFMSVIGYLLICWYIFWEGVLIDLILHPSHRQPDMYLLYVIIDISTFAYFFFNVYIEKIYYSKILTLLANFLIIWYLAFSFVDIFIPSEYAPNNSSVIFNILMIGLTTLTAVMILCGEVEKYRLNLHR